MWKKFKGLFEAKKCEICGEMPSQIIEHSGWSRHYMCRCDCYRMACTRPDGCLHAVDTHTEAKLRENADTMFKSQELLCQIL